MEEIETIIVGAGQAGLSVARYLKEFERPYVILEQESEIGSSWKNRYDSLTLDSFAKYSYLEGFPFFGDPMRHPAGSEVITYLKSFADKFDLKPGFNTKVLNVIKKGEKFVVSTGKGTYVSKNVVLATGPFHEPMIPKASKDLPSSILQIHSRDYRNPGMLLPGPALVVGGGNSGVEIAEEIADSGKQVFFSFNGKLRSVRSSWWSQWLAYRLGLAHVPKKTLLGKIIMWYTRGKPVGVDVEKLLQNPNIAPVGTFAGVENGKIICGQKVIQNISNIVWATGYQNDFSIVSIPGFEPESQNRGVTNIPGLYVLNMRWQYSKSSSHLAGISRDAKFVAEDIIRKLI